MHLSELEQRTDRHPSNPANIFCPNGTIASTADTALGMAIMREVLRQNGYGGDSVGS